MNDNTNESKKSSENRVEPKLHASEADKKREEKEQPVVEMFFTKDGTPVETSTLTPETTAADYDLTGRPDVHKRTVPADKANSIKNESELDEDDK